MVSNGGIVLLKPTARPVMMLVAAPPSALELAISRTGLPAVKYSVSLAMTRPQSRPTMTDQYTLISPVTKRLITYAPTMKIRPVV